MPQPPAAGDKEERVRVRVHHPADADDDFVMVSPGGAPAAPQGAPAGQASPTAAAPQAPPAAAAAAAAEPAGAAGSAAHADPAEEPADSGLESGQSTDFSWVCVGPAVQKEAAPWPDDAQQQRAFTSEEFRKALYSTRDQRGGMAWLGRAFAGFTRAVGGSGPPLRAPDHASPRRIGNTAADAQALLASVLSVLPAAGGGDAEAERSPRDRLSSRQGTEDWVPPSGLSGSVVAPRLPEAAQRRGPPVTLSEVEAAQGPDGSISNPDWQRLQEAVFRRGCDDAARPQMWKYLLGVELPSDDRENRAARREARQASYEALRCAAEAEEAEGGDSAGADAPGAHQAFGASTRLLIKDVRRTDRDDPLYADEDGEGLRALRRMLLGHSLQSPRLGYCQGMSDLCAVLYQVIRDEADCYAAFRQLLRRGPGEVFERPESAGEDLGRFIAVVDPELGAKVAECDPGFVFVFRWLVVLFKREFDLPGVLQLWDAFFACPGTVRYHVVVAAAVLRALAPQLAHLGYDQLARFAQGLGKSVDVNDVLGHAEIMYDRLRADGRSTLDEALPPPPPHNELR
eukprot:TRINITY_DN30418_c1_g1_i3.p1 TRINITY_DN30418_c1_g1~~TRINITY_DN30418_c1_g1_i3.p1  ORF type:complete len:602 (+),score=201.23 TRINITY_DN30418_c1_g1_i3:99-1808(+)